MCCSPAESYGVFAQIGSGSGAAPTSITKPFSTGAPWSAPRPRPRRRAGCSSALERRRRSARPELAVCSVQTGASKNRILARKRMEHAGEAAGFEENGWKEWATNGSALRPPMHQLEVLLVHNPPDAKWILSVRSPITGPCVAGPCVLQYPRFSQVDA